MVNVIFYTNQQPQSLEIERRLQEAIKPYAIQQVDYTTRPDYIVTIGGDGTLLAAFHQFTDWLDSVQFIGIHTGHLGFYADWQTHELAALVASLARKSRKYISYPLLQVDLFDDTNTLVKTVLALNEFSMRTVSGTMVAQVCVKDHFFETFRGDGLCIATPTGSTGLSKSLGGAVMHPRIAAIQLTEMAPLNNRIYRTLGAPMIIPRDEYFDIQLSGEHTTIMMMDHLVCAQQPIQRVRARVAHQSIKFASFKHTHFWDRVENSFIGHKNNQRGLTE